MSTFPRMKSPMTPTGTAAASVALMRAPSDFDAGINSSNAWTAAEALSEQRDRILLQTQERELSERADVLSLSDDEKDAEVAEGGEEIVLTARAVYDFKGKSEFEELSLRAGDEFEILKEVVAEGWSLARHGDVVGLVPRAFYIFTNDFVSSPPEELELANAQRVRDASTASLTPRCSLTRPAPAPAPSPAPLLPQSTGEWFRALPSMRRSLLGGKSLNRFSGFVTSGAEAWILNGSSDDTSEPIVHAKEASGASMNSMAGRVGEADMHYVDAGPAWRSKLPPFQVLVHSPEKHSSPITGAYTMYSVTSVFDTPDHNGIVTADEEPADIDIHRRSSSFIFSTSSGWTPCAPPASARVTVQRRFSHFVFLHTALVRRLPGIAFPPLPAKQYAGRFSAAFVEARRRDLQHYVNTLVRHPVVRYAEVLTFFLGCDSDLEWRRQLPRHLAAPPAGPGFYARVYHPHFNIDVEDAANTKIYFPNHVRAVDKGLQQLRAVFGKIRSARCEMSNADRLLSYSLLSLITSTPIATSTVAEEDEDDADGEPMSKTKLSGHVNSDGAWCWREDCADCLRLTKCMQRTAETLQSVAQLYDSHARRTMLETHESLKDLAHSSAMFSPVVETHSSALTRYREALEIQDGDAIASRCETVLNTTMAEFDTYHTQKKENFERITKQYLDDEIHFYEKVVSRLRTARRLFDIPDEELELLMPGPRQPSIYERDLAEPNLVAAPLPLPCPHVLDSAPMRPVSLAVQNGLGLLFGDGAGAGDVGGHCRSASTASHGGTSAAQGRSSAFRRFW